MKAAKSLQYVFDRFLDAFLKKTDTATIIKSDLFFLPSAMPYTFFLFCVYRDLDSWDITKPNMYPENSRRKTIVSFLRSYISYSHYENDYNVLQIKIFDTTIKVKHGGGGGVI